MKIVPSLFSLIPLLSFPQLAGAVTVLDDLFIAAYYVIAWLIALVIGVGVLVFVWGLTLFVLRAGDEKGREEGRARMLWGVVTLFVMVTIWGVVEVISQTIGVNGVVSCQAPYIGPNYVSSCIF